MRTVTCFKATVVFLMLFAVAAGCVGLGRMKVGKKMPSNDVFTGELERCERCELSNFH